MGVNTRRSIQMSAGTSWSITDEALAQIDLHLASPDPEHGAALLAPAGTRIITEILPDPRPGEKASYWHSDELREQLNRLLLERPSMRYVGTVHSHPSGFAEPSSQDHNAFESTLKAIPELHNAIFPIVVQAERGKIGSSARFGTRHLIDLDHGVFAGFSANLVDGRISVMPAPMRVVPIRAHAELIAQYWNGVSGGNVAPSRAMGVTVDGSKWLHVQLVDQGSPNQTNLHVVFPPTYPTSAPMWCMGVGNVFAAPAWDLSKPVDERIRIAVVAFARAEDLQPFAGKAEEIRFGIQARLHQHLPANNNSHVLVFGAGSVGSNAAELLVRSGVKRITVVDFDTVEAANLSRTVYAASDVGMLKVDALGARLLSIAPDVQFNGMACTAQEIDHALFDEVDVAVLATDDPGGESWLNHMLYSKGIPFTSIKLFAGAEAGEILFVIPVERTACMGCMLGPMSAATRGDINYGTGRLVAESALGPDIVAITARGVKAALALTQLGTGGPMAQWIEPLSKENRTYHLTSTVRGWGIFGHISPQSGPFEGLWIKAVPAPGCSVCGDDPLAVTTPLTPLELSGDVPIGPLRPWATDNGSGDR